MYNILYYASVYKKVTSLIADLYKQCIDHCWARSLVVYDLTAEKYKLIPYFYIQRCRTAIRDYLIYTDKYKHKHKKTTYFINDGFTGPLTYGFLFIF